MATKKSPILLPDSARKGLSCDEPKQEGLSCALRSPDLNDTGGQTAMCLGGGCGPRTSLWPVLLGALRGTVLELGPGDGGNLRHYAPDVRWLGIEPSDPARSRARAEASRLGMRAQVLPGRAEDLELGDGSVDAVVCSFVLCSVDEPGAVFAQISRVLRFGGRFVFAEHVAASRGTWVRRAQNLLALLPGTRCRPNRETGRAITGAGFTIVDLHQFDLAGPFGVRLPQIVGAAEKGHIS